MSIEIATKVRSISEGILIYCATTIGLGLLAFSISRIIDGTAIILNHTQVPEFRVKYEVPPAFSSTGICVGCKFEPWQHVDIGMNAPDRMWIISNIEMKMNDDGTGSIGCTYPKPKEVTSPVGIKDKE